MTGGRAITNRSNPLSWEPPNRLRGGGPPPPAAPWATVEAPRKPPLETQFGPVQTLPLSKALLNRAATESQLGPATLADQPTTTYDLVAPCAQFVGPTPLPPL